MYVVLMFLCNVGEQNIEINVMCKTIFLSNLNKMSYNFIQLNLNLDAEIYK